MSVLLSAAIAVLAAMAAQMPRPWLHGRVMHADLPVPGATVTASRDDHSVITTTNDAGAFAFSALEAGAWTIRIEMLGFSTVKMNVSMPRAQIPLTVTLVMRPYAEIVTSAGTSSAPWPEAAAAADAPQILSGSLVNGAATVFAQPRAIGNNRPRPNPLYTGNVAATLGHSAWDARPYAFGAAVSAPPRYATAQVALTFGGPLQLPLVRRQGPPTTISLHHGVQTTATTQTALMPTPSERRGDFSSHAIALRDPQTGQLFAGNVIPGDRIAPQAAALLELYPMPTGTSGAGANFQRPIVGRTTSAGFQVATTYPVNARTSLRGSLGYQRATTRSANLFDFIDEHRQSSIVAGLTWAKRFSTRLTVSANYQFRSSEDAATPFFADRVNVSGDAGIAGANQDPRHWGPPTIVFPDVADLRAGHYQRTATTSHTAGAQVQLRRGRHNLTFGAGARLHQLELLAQTDPRGTLTFTGAATGSAFADFLLGLPATSAIAFGNTGARLRGGSYDAYLNDDFRVAPGLTFDLGVRWEYESPYTERDGHLANLDVTPGFTAGVSVLGSDPVGALTGISYPPSLVSRDRRGIQPRLGVSWRPNLASPLVIRAGYGLYRNLGVYQSIGTLLAQQPPFSTSVIVQHTDATPLTLAAPFPAGRPSRTTFAVDPNFRTALLHSFQLSVQRDLPASLTVIATLFADRGRRLTQAFLPNTVPPGATNPCPACPAGFVYLTSGGTSTRHAAQIALRRRLAAGFTANVTYTLAESIDNAATFSNSTVSPGSLSVAQNWLDLDAERAPSAFDQRHLVAADVQYTTGVGVMGGTLLDGFWGTLYKDWTVTAQLSAGSGLPITPVFFAVVPGTGTVGIRPSLTGQPIAPADPDTYANRAAFMAPAPGSWGDAGRHSVRGPATSTFDLALARVFRLPRRKTIELRMTATNVLNRVVLTSIDRIIDSPQFGRPTTASPMRRVRVLVRFGF